MKKNVVKHSLLIAAMLGVFMFSLTQMASARKLPPPLKFILVTRCCGEGQTSYYSTDCIEGEGFCVDQRCQPGETEIPVDCP